MSCKNCTKKYVNNCNICEHLSVAIWYYNSCKTPIPYIYIFLLYPYSKIPSPKRSSIVRCFLFLRRKPFSFRAMPVEAPSVPIQTVIQLFLLAYRRRWAAFAAFLIEYAIYGMPYYRQVYVEIFLICIVIIPIMQYTEFILSSPQIRRYERWNI